MYLFRNGSSVKSDIHFFLFKRGVDQNVMDPKKVILHPSFGYKVLASFSTGSPEVQSNDLT